MLLLIMFCLQFFTFILFQIILVSDLNTVGKDSISVFGNINVLDKDAHRQYLYCLTPKYDTTTGPKIKLDSIHVGHLNIEWRSNLGEKGRLQTSMLQTVVRKNIFNFH